MRTNQVRIIGGLWRSRLLPFPDVVGLRPTPDRVRETLFNWLGQDMTGKVCLDLFAGSGVLGFEALSRGARQVVMVERDPRVMRTLRDSAALLKADKCELVADDALKFLARESRRFDLILLDPPYDARLLPRLFPVVGALLSDGGLVYAESDAPVEAGPGWQSWKSGQAGQVHYCLFKKVC